MQVAYLFVSIYLIFIYSTRLSLIKEKSLEIFRFILLVITLALFWGLRDQSIGNDSVTYIKIFQNPESYPSKLEPGFLFLLEILKFFSLSGNFLLFSLSFILLFLQLLVYYKFNQRDFFVYFIIYSSFYYYYQFHINIMRQGLAILMVAMSFFAYKRKNSVVYFIWGIIGCLFHATALIFLIYPVFLKKIENRKTQLFFVFCILLMFFTNFASSIINSIPAFHWSIEKIKWYFVIAEPVRIKQSHAVSLFIILLFTLKFEKMKKSPYFFLYTFHTVFFAFLGIFHECLLVYDRFYFYLQIFEPCLLYEFRVLFKEKTIYKKICLAGSLLMSSVTVFLWGPRNFLTPYTFQFMR